MPVSASRPEQSNDPQHRAESSSAGQVWVPVVNLVVGVAVVLAALTFSEHISDPIGRFGYVPVMFFYVVVMMIGGGLMVSGFMTLWRKATGTSNSQN